jgi:hypothetical protein
MRYIIFLCLLVCMLSHNGKAQKTGRYLPGAGTTFIRANPAGLLDFYDHNLSFGIEHRLSDHWAMSVDAAWIFASQYARNQGKATGFVIRPAVRRYFGRSRKLFAEAELHYKEVYYRIEDWIGRDCVNDVPAYEEYTSFRFRKQVAGLHIKGGIQFPISRNRRFWMEAYTGLGVHYRKQGLYKEKPNSCYDLLNNGLAVGPEIRESEQWLPALPLGFRIMYRVSRK